MRTRTHEANLLSILLLSVFGFTGCATSTNATSKKTDPVVGRRLDFFLKNIEGQAVRADSFRGKALIVDFWASWCAPCKDAMPFYDELQAKHPDEMVIVGISVDENIADMKESLKQRPVNFLILHDESGKLAEQLDVTAMPSTYFVDKNGMIKSVHRGFVHSDRAHLTKTAEALLHD
jgi:thiol-disulfide isomerase/thioredoxin